MDVLCGINKKKKDLERHLFATQFHCLLFVQYSHTFFTTKQNDLSKKKEEQQKLYDMNVRAIYGCRQAGRHCRLMKKRKIWQDICNSVALHVYKATHILFRNRLTYQRKTMDDKKFTM